MLSAHKKLSKKLFISVVLSGLLVTCPAAWAATITFGAPGTNGNTFPFGGGFSPATRYQQVYNAALFPTGPLSITDITFFHTLDPLGSIKPNTYIFHLSTTSQAVNGLDTTVLTNNIGGDDALFASLALSGNPGALLTISGTPFTYDPANGNLLLDITTTVPNTGGFATGFDFQQNFGTDSSRAHDYGGGFASLGLVTQFTFTSTAAVPEPGTWLLLTTGLVGLLGYGWRRRQRVA